MLVVGAKGMAKEVLEILHRNLYEKKIVFFDNINNDIQNKIYDKFKIIKDINNAKKFFADEGSDYTIGIGGPKKRKDIFKQFSEIGGKLLSVISSNADIGHFNTTIEAGCIVTSGVKIMNDVKIEKACIINLNSTISHDSSIGEFSEICPNVNITGNCKVGSNVFIGTNATILPKIKIGSNSIIGAGSVVTKNIPKNVLAFGVPAKIIKSIK